MDKIHTPLAHFPLMQCKTMHIYLCLSFLTCVSICIC